MQKQGRNNNIVRRYQSVSVIKKKGRKWIADWLIPKEQRTTNSATQAHTKLMDLGKMDLKLLAQVAYDSKRNFDVQSTRNTSINKINWKNKANIAWENAYTFPTLTKNQKTLLKQVQKMTDKEKRCAQMKNTQKRRNYSRQTDEQYQQNRKLLISKKYELRSRSEFSFESIVTHPIQEHEFEISKNALEYTICRCTDCSEMIYANGETYIDHYNPTNFTKRFLDDTELNEALIKFGDIVQ